VECTKIVLYFVIVMFSLFYIIISCISALVKIFFDAIKTVSQKILLAPSLRPRAFILSEYVNK